MKCIPLIIEQLVHARLVAVVQKSRHYDKAMQHNINSQVFASSCDVGSLTASGLLSDRPPSAGIPQKLSVRSQSCALDRGEAPIGVVSGH